MKRLVPFAALFFCGSVWPNVFPPDEALTLGRNLPETALTTDGGRQIQLSALTGKPLIISPVFTSCRHTCTPITRSLSKATQSLKAKGMDFRVLTLSFDPEDRVDNLRALRDSLNLPPEWTLAIADDVNRAQILKALDFHTLRLEEGGFAHPNLVAVVDRNLKIVQYVYGVDFKPEQIERALNQADGNSSWFFRSRLVLFWLALAGVFASGIFVLRTAQI